MKQGLTSILFSFVNCDKLILFPVDCGFTTSHLWMNNSYWTPVIFFTSMWLGISLVLAQYIDKVSVCTLTGYFSKLLQVNDKMWILKLKDMSKFDFKMTRNNKIWIGLFNRIMYPPCTLDKSILFFDDQGHWTAVVVGGAIRSSQGHMHKEWQIICNQVFILMKMMKGNYLGHGHGFGGICEMLSSDTYCQFWKRNHVHFFKSFITILGSFIE